MSKMFVPCLLLALLVGCGSQVRLAKDSLEQKLVTRELVDYRDVRTYPGYVVCGDFRPRDRDGNLLKWRRFIAIRGVANDYPSDRDWAVYCSDDSAAALLSQYGIGPIDENDPTLQRIRADMKILGEALARYRDDGNPRYPMTLTELVPVYLDAVPDDPWGRSYHYDTGSLGFGSAGPYTLLTLGADGKPGGSGEDADIAETDLVYIDHILAL